jgi:hypothetical protein
LVFHLTAELWKSVTNRFEQQFADTEAMNVIDGLVYELTVEVK